MGTGKMNKKIILVILFSVGLCKIVAKSMELLCDKCRYNPKHFNIFNLTIVENSIYAEMGIKRKITFGIKFYIDIELRLQKYSEFNSVFKTTLDICSVIGSLRNNLYQKWLGSMLQNGNFSANCPVKPGYYYLHGWKLNDGLIPAFVFSGDYRIQLHGFYGRHKTATEDMVMHCMFNVKLS